jgi:hypothetical protein
MAMKQQLTRRGIFTAVAGATAGAALAVPSIATASTTSGIDEIIKRARAVAGTPLPQPDAITARARVALCRAWDHQVYLVVDDDVHGFATVDPRTFAIAVAAQLVDRPLAIHYWGHRSHGNGTGAFEGVLVAADLRDLPEGSKSWR